MWDPEYANNVLPDKTCCLSLCYFRKRFSLYPLCVVVNGDDSEFHPIFSLLIYSPFLSVSSLDIYWRRIGGLMNLLLRLFWYVKLVFVLLSQFIKAIREAQPHCSFILDANGKYTSEEAIMLLEKLNEMDVSLVLFEQPVHKNDLRGLADLSAIARGKYGIHENIVDVINIKLAKFGVLGALQVIDIARKSCLNLVMDCLVKIRLATRFASHLAAGFRWFKYVNLDAPFLLLEDSIFGGYEVTRLVYSFTNARGQGGFIKQVNVARLVTTFPFFTLILVVLILSIFFRSHVGCYQTNVEYILCCNIL
ncbi:hypothetical protein UlMin_021932 [Ulmus minor]